jgi:hypothetical protein
MLIIRGLSPNLKASDFHRLIPSGLSGWNSIKQVQQRRNSRTLEPQGIYHITFTSATARRVYHDKLLRLHQLAKHKLDFPIGGAWQFSVPPQLRAGAEDLDDEVDSFTLVPGSLPVSGPVKRRAGVPKNWWSRQLEQRVRRFGLGDRPPAVLVRVHPPTMTAAMLAEAIERNGDHRGLPWDVCEPLPLSSEELLDGAELLEKEESLNETHGGEGQTGSKSGHKAQALQNSRFVVVCANEDEAHRFHRYWNQKNLLKPWLASHTKGMKHWNKVHASKIHW